MSPQPTLEVTSAVAGIASQLNPFTSLQPLLDSGVKAIIPFVSVVSTQTTENIIGNAGLAFYMTLLFMISLLVIIFSDRINMTRSLRTTLLAVHFALIRILRAIVTVGLFFLGTQVGRSGGNFVSGLEAATPFISTATITFFMQKIIEWISEVDTNQAYAADVYKPLLLRDNLLSSILLVLYDYLFNFNLVVHYSLVGQDNISSGDFVTPDLVSGNDSNGPAAGQVKTLYNAYSANLIGDVSRMERSKGQSQVWYYSPLFVGVVVGLFSGGR